MNNALNSERQAEAGAPRTTGHLPNALIIGAPKCATTTLFAWLSHHPDVSVPKRKELQYLVDPGSAIFRADSNYGEHGLAGYAQHFDRAAPVVLEATPGYLYQRTALDVLATELPNAKLIMVVRDPVERFLSVHRYYRHNKPVLPSDLPLDTYLDQVVRRDPALPADEFVRDALSHGEYATHLDRWSERCGRDRIMVISSDVIRRQPEAVIAELGAWLDLAPTGFAGLEYEDANVTYTVRNQHLHRVIAKVRTVGVLQHDTWVKRTAVTAYRKLNVRDRRPAEAGMSVEAQVSRRLAEHYRPFDEALAARYGIDVTGWASHTRS